MSFTVVVQETALRALARIRAEDKEALPSRCNLPAGVSAELPVCVTALSISRIRVRRLGDRPDRREREDVVTMMMMYDMTRQYQAERRMSAAEQRRADEQLGRMAARVSRFWQRATSPARKLHGTLGYAR